MSTYTTERSGDAGLDSYGPETTFEAAARRYGVHLDDVIDLTPSTPASAGSVVLRCDGVSCATATRHDTHYGEVVHVEPLLAGEYMALAGMVGDL